MLLSLLCRFLKGEDVADEKSMLLLTLLEFSLDDERRGLYGIPPAISCPLYDEDITSPADQRMLLLAGGSRASPDDRLLLSIVDKRLTPDRILFSRSIASIIFFW